MRILKYILISLAVFFLNYNIASAQTIFLDGARDDQGWRGTYTFELPDDYVCVSYPTTRYNDLPRIAIRFAKNVESHGSTQINFNLPVEFYTNTGNHNFAVGIPLCDTSDVGGHEWAMLYTVKTDWYWIDIQGTYEYNSEAEAIQAIKDWAFLPDIEWDSEQDFNSYNPDTPLTDISNIQFDGFTINNPNELDFDVIQKTTLFGLKWENGEIVPDHSNILYQSTFNGALAHVSPTTNGFFAPDSFYNWGIKDSVIAAYDAYIENVSVKELPGYSWLNSFNGKLLPVKYIPDWFNNYYASFFENGCLSVTYYVRYNAASSVSGQWTKYIRTGKNISQTAVSGGSIQNSFDEKTVQLIETTDGMQRPAVSATELGISTNEYDITDLKNTVSSFRDLLGDVPVLYASLFGFLPSWVGGWIALLISVGVVMSIYHLIRG